MQASRIEHGGAIETVQVIIDSHRSEIINHGANERQCIWRRLTAHRAAASRNEPTPLAGKGKHSHVPSRITQLGVRHLTPHDEHEKRALLREAARAVSLTEGNTIESLRALIAPTRAPPPSRTLLASALIRLREIKVHDLRGQTSSQKDSSSYADVIDDEKDENEGVLISLIRRLDGCPALARRPRQVMAQPPLAQTFDHTGRLATLRPSGQSERTRKARLAPSRIALRLHLRAPLMAMLVGAGVRRSKEAGTRARPNLRIAMRQRATKAATGVVRVRLKLSASVHNPKITIGRAIWPARRQKRTEWVHRKIHDVAIELGHSASQQEIVRTCLTSITSMPTPSELNGTIGSASPTQVGSKIIARHHLADFICHHVLRRIDWHRILERQNGRNVRHGKRQKQALAIRHTLHAAMTEGGWGFLLSHVNVGSSSERKWLRRAQNCQRRGRQRRILHAALRRRHERCCHQPIRSGGKAHVGGGGRQQPPRVTARGEDHVLSDRRASIEAVTKNDEHARTNRRSHAWHMAQRARRNSAPRLTRSRAAEGH